MCLHTKEQRTTSSPKYKCNNKVNKVQVFTGLSWIFVDSLVGAKTHFTHSDLVVTIVYINFI
jgi:hypothetical protein